MCGVGGIGEKAIDMRKSEKGGGKMTNFFFVIARASMPSSSLNTQDLCARDQ